MSNKITLEEEKKVGASYAYIPQEQIRKVMKHGRNQIIRILQPKNLAWLLYHETQLHELTKYANKHLQEKLEEKNMDKIVLLCLFFMISLSLVISIYFP